MIPSTMLQVFRSRKMAAIALLGFASGFPYLITNRVLQTWLTMSGINLSTIGFLSLAGLPYSLKFLWAPLLDRYAFPGLGRRRGWLLASQILLAVAIATMTFQDPKVTLQWLSVNVVAIAFLSATQDITADAYRVDTLKPDEATAGAGVFVSFYRVALIATGSFAFLIADRTSWPATHLILAGSMIGVAVLTTRVPEPAQIRPPETLRDAVLIPFAEFASRLGARQAIWTLLFVVLFRLGDAMLSNMATPFLVKTGFTLNDIGVIQGGVGLGATLVGALASGAIANRVGIYRALWICGSLQAFSNLSYLVLAWAGHNYVVMISTVIVENLCYGLGATALVGFLTTLCNPRFSATQYALLSSVVAAGRDLLASPAGRLAETLGWSVFFFLTFVAALPALALLPLFKEKARHQDMINT